MYGHREQLQPLSAGIGINSAGGQRVFGSAPEDSGLPTPSGPGLYSARVTIPANLLLAGHYAVALCLWAPEGIQDYPDPAFSFRVEAGPSPAYRADSTREGLVQVLCPWEIASA